MSQTEQSDEAEQSERKERLDAAETTILKTVAAAELEALDPGPDPDSAALMTSDLRSRGVKPVRANNPGGVACPECGQPLVIAPVSGKDYVVCFAALAGDGACSFYREMPKKAAETSGPKVAKAPIQKITKAPATSKAKGKK